MGSILEMLTPYTNVRQEGLHQIAFSRSESAIIHHNNRIQCSMAVGCCWYPENRLVLMDFIDKDVGHLSCQMAATIKMDSAHHALHF